MKKFVELKEKINRLKTLDKDFSVFGSKSHKYKFEKCLTESEISEIEQKIGIELPEDYRNFLKIIGNGGAGPYYGLNKLNKYLEEYDNKPFPYKEHYHLDYDKFKKERINEKSNEEIISEYWEKYSDEFHVQGSLIIGHFGCSKFFRIIINGDNQGDIWLDNIGDSDGLNPQYKNFKINETADFFWWSDNWLNENINEIEANGNKI